MRRILIACLVVSFAAGAFFLKAKIDRLPTVSLEGERQQVSPSGRAARLEVGLGPEADPQTFEARLNGEDVTARFRFGRDGAVGQVAPLRKGENQLSVSVRDRSGALHRDALRLEAPRPREPRDLSAELHETARDLLMREIDAARSPDAPRRLSDVVLQSRAAVAELTAASERGRGSEGPAEAVADLAAALDPALDEARLELARTRKFLESEGLRDKLEQLDALEADTLAGLRELRDALASAQSGDPAAVRAARDRIERVTRAPELPPAAPPRNEMPPPLERPALDLLREASGADLSVHPELAAQRPDPVLGKWARELAAELCPGAAFDEATGVITGGQALTAPDLFPARAQSRDEALNRWFSAHVGPDDQLLCLLHLAPEARARFVAVVDAVAAT